MVENDQHTAVPSQYLVLIPEQMDVLLEGASVGSPGMVREESLGWLQLKIEGLLRICQSKAQLGSFKLLQVLHQ